jgi:hypothetical protein
LPDKLWDTPVTIKSTVLPYTLGKNSVLTSSLLYIFIPEIPSKVRFNLNGMNPTVPPEVS